MDVHVAGREYDLVNYSEYVDTFNEYASPVLKMDALDFLSNGLENENPDKDERVNLKLETRGAPIFLMFNLSENEDRICEVEFEGVETFDA